MARLWVAPDNGEMALVVAVTAVSAEVLSSYLVDHRSQEVVEVLEVDSVSRPDCGSSLDFDPANTGHSVVELPLEERWIPTAALGVPPHFAGRPVGEHPVALGPQLGLGQWLLHCEAVAGVSEHVHFEDPGRLLECRHR